jgi:hypothetical protein
LRFLCAEILECQDTGAEHTRPSSPAAELADGGVRCSIYDMLIQTLIDL